MKNILLTLSATALLIFGYVLGTEHHTRPVEAEFYVLRGSLQENNGEPNVQYDPRQHLDEYRCKAEGAAIIGEFRDRAEENGLDWNIEGLTIRITAAGGQTVRIEFECLGVYR